MQKDEMIKTGGRLKNITLRRQHLPERDNESHFFAARYENRVIPDYLSWSYNLRDDSLIFIGNRANFPGVEDYTFTSFIGRIKSCFRSQFTDAVFGYLNMINETTPPEGIYLAINVPIKLKPNVYHYCKVSVVAHGKGKTVTEIILIVNPVKRNANDNFYTEVKINGIANQALTTLLKKHISPPAIKLTQKQQAILQALIEGKHASEIAEAQGVVINSVYKINRKIMEKLSQFYEMEFKDAREAADYYFASY
nr:hypothetical protein [uncultured Flavobacterium sp.]